MKNELKRIDAFTGVVLLMAAAVIIIGLAKHFIQ